MGCSLLAVGQFHNPVKWSTSYEHVGGDEFMLVYKASIEDGWNIYSQYLESDDGPIPTSFTYDDGTHFELMGKNEEGGDRKEVFDEVFQMNVAKFFKEAIFSQKVKVVDYSKPITGYLEFMTCDDKQCLPPAEESFEFAITKPTGSKKKEEKKEEEELFNNSKDASVKASIPEDNIGTVDLEDIDKGSGGFVNPVEWSIKQNALSDAEIEVTFTAEIDEGWSIYSQLTPDDGPLPTEFFFDEGTHYERVGGVEESGKKKEGIDPVFGVNVIKFSEGPVLFKQKLKVIDAKVPITGALSYMVCDDSKCFPEEIPFKVLADQKLALLGPETEEAVAMTGSEKNDNFTAIYGFDQPKVDEPMSAECGTQDTIKESSFLNIFFLGFLGGLLALLTPCVFPMIPLTVSFFTKGAEDQSKGIGKAFTYGLFIFLIYLLLSVPFHVMDSVDADILNQISTNVWLNVAFFLIFLFFAFSFFGYYEITLPSSWVNQSSSAENVGGMLGVFFMALTLALVSFSCTGPILGTLLAGALSSSGGAWQLSAGMGGFGLALALPFGLFAAFPSWMNALPKSGGWLNSVKVVLGFIELGLAFKFLSNADLVEHWGVLKIEPFLIIWILVSLGLATYLFGWVKFPHDSPIKKLGWGRVSLGLVALAFAIYMGFGFRVDKVTGSYQPLTLLSGLAPPVCYSFFNPCDCPQGLDCYKDYYLGLEQAKKLNKPLLIDFTGYACVNCRKMEEHVWPEKAVYNQIKDDYVLVSLYVDDKKALPEAEQQTVNKITGGTRKLRNYGHKWANFQEYFGANSQPYYVLLTPEGKLLTKPVGYTPDVEEFSSFLECGISTFRRLSEAN